MRMKNVISIWPVDKDALKKHRKWLNKWLLSVSHNILPSAKGY